MVVALFMVNCSRTTPDSALPPIVARELRVRAMPSRTVFAPLLRSAT